MNIVIKYFHELTTQELYNILQLRSEVFVVDKTVFTKILTEKIKRLFIFFLQKITKLLHIQEYLMKANILKIRV